jgi:hypothetical protein
VDGRHFRHNLGDHNRLNLPAPLTSSTEARKRPGSPALIANAYVKQSPKLRRPAPLASDPHRRDKASVLLSDTAPISLRLSAPLLERIDKLADREGRSRSNLIQRILWGYVRGGKETGKP